MELTWVAIAASLMMGLGAACLFIFAVKKNWFHNIEDAKYQVFWSDVEELVDSTKESGKHDNHTRENSKKSGRKR